MIKGTGGIYAIGLFGRTVEIAYNNGEAKDLIHFLFQDLPPVDAPISSRRFDVLFAGKPARMSLWQEEKQLYFGASKHALASLLANEILYECIVNNRARNEKWGQIYYRWNRLTYYNHRMSIISGNNECSLAILHLHGALPPSLLDSVHDMRII